MSELGETFHAWKAAHMKKRADNRENSTQMLEAAGIAFSSHNNGAHLIVYGKFATFDFWPGTGKWVRRPTKLYQRGVKQLMKELQKEQ